MFGPCFVIEYFLSFLALQLSRWERESLVPYFYCHLDVMWLLSFFPCMHMAPKTTSYQRQCDVMTSH